MSPHMVLSGRLSSSVLFQNLQKLPQKAAVWTESWVSPGQLCSDRCLGLVSSPQPLSNEVLGAEDRARWWRAFLIEALGP